MAHTKAQGAAKNLRDSQPKYLGVKISDGQKIKKGAIIVRQRGTKILAGESVGVGKDHTLFALKNGTVRFSKKLKTRFDNKKIRRSVANVVSI